MNCDILGRCLVCGFDVPTSGMCTNCHTYATRGDVGKVVNVVLTGTAPTFTQQPAPVSATEPDAVRTLREGMRGQHALFNVNQEYVCAVAPLLEHIDALTARLAEAERVTVDDALKTITQRIKRLEDVQHCAQGLLATVFVAPNADEKVSALIPHTKALADAITAARGGG